MEQSQLEQVIQAWGRDILRFCRMTAGNSDSGDELYQDTMVVLLGKTLDEAQNPKAFALGTALRLWENRKRKFARRLRLAPSDSLEALQETGGVAVQTESPEEAVLLEAQKAQIRALVAQLPEAYRLPITLHYSASLSVHDMADLLHLPENTVKSRLLRGRQLLKKELEALGYDGTTA